MSSLNDLASLAVANAVALYTARDGAAVRAILQRGYAPDATFDDGVICVRGNPDLLVQFTALKVFPQVSVVPLAGGQDLDVKTTAPGKALVQFRNTQAYSLPFSLTTFSLTVDKELEVDSGSGRIARHVDRWRSAGLGGGALTVPVLVRPPGFVRSLLGKTSSLAMRAAGVGGAGGGGGGGGGGDARGGGVAGKLKSLLHAGKAD